MSATASTPQAAARTWAELDVSALRHNAGVARECAGPEGGVMAVVKADAYGHGAALLGRELEKAGVEALGVATLAEAQELRAAGVTRPVYLLSPVTPGERASVGTTDCIPAVSSVEEAAAFSALAGSAGRKQPVHVVFDTGMGRIGVLEAGAVDAMRQITALPGVVIDSVGSHFPSADEDELFTSAQLDRYRALLAALREAGMTVDRHHIANSAGALRLPRTGRELVRVGLMLYGVSPVPEHQGRLQPVMTWKAQVVLTRTLPTGWGVSYGRTVVTTEPTRVATLAVGYADGYSRALSGRGAWVGLGGRRCPVLGRVTMDQVVVEAPESVMPGEAATLLGPAGPTAMELAVCAGTIPYTLFTGIGRRVERRLVNIAALAVAG